MNRGLLTEGKQRLAFFVYMSFGSLLTENTIESTDSNVALWLSLQRIITEGVPQSRNAVWRYTTEVMSPKKATARHHGGRAAGGERGAEIHDRGNRPLIPIPSIM